jgi:hypothetical protein
MTATLFALPDANSAAAKPLPPIWKREKCAVCGGGFSEASWDARHTDPRDGLQDVHEDCCPALDCSKMRGERKRRAAAIVAARALLASLPAELPAQMRWEPTP